MTKAEVARSTVLVDLPIRNATSLSVKAGASANTAKMSSGVFTFISTRIFSWEIDTQSFL
ncbi:hypothetical protein ACB316_09050 [Aeromonas sanarellii]|uniref:hypothetical protein n=1 Tax=Aeromonas salmonicida TaxID=645 RepID=UPI003D1AF15D